MISLGQISHKSWSGLTARHCLFSSRTSFLPPLWSFPMVNGSSYAACGLCPLCWNNQLQLLLWNKCWIPPSLISSHWHHLAFLCPRRAELAMQLAPEWQAKDCKGEEVRENRRALPTHTESWRSFPLFYLLKLSQDQEGKYKMNTGKCWADCSSGFSMVSTVYPLLVLVVSKYQLLDHKTH